MVKVTFNTAFAQKDVKKDSETLIPDDKDPEVAHFVGRQSRAWCWCFCLGLALMLSGLVVGGAYLYRYYVMEKFYNSRNQMHTFTPQQSPKEELLKEGQVFVCGVKYREEDFMIQEEDDGMPEDSPVGLRMVGEHVRILQDQEVELINVPVPEFSDSDPADIVHDFNKRLTAYLDLSLNKCYVIPLNTSVVMPPRDFVDLLINIKAGTYLPQTYMVREQMMVTEKLDEVDQLGYFINRLCREKDTYRLQRRETILGMQKREALSCHKIRHFENKFVVETMICEP